MNKKTDDLKYGFISEERIHNFLEYYYGPLKNTQDNESMGKYFEYDKYNDDCFIEIKTRRLNHDKWPTLMFGHNKFLKGEELKKENPKLRIFYVFKCIDTICYWEHDTTDYKVLWSGRSDRGVYEYADCVHIKTADLKFFDDERFFSSAL